VDISSKAIAWAREHYGPYYAEKTLGDLKAQATRYDMVIMNQLIEHLPDVHPFLDEALGLLTEGGELIVTTPNKSAYPGAIWETDLPPCISGGSLKSHCGILRRAITARSRSSISTLHRCSRSGEGAVSGAAQRATGPR